MRLPASMELLWKLELLCPASVVSNKSPFRELPKKFFPGSPDLLETQWRNVASAGFSSHLTIYAFWLEVESFQDAGGNHCFQDLALGAIKTLILPISNDHVERAFSQVSLLKMTPEIEWDCHSFQV